MRKPSDWRLYNNYPNPFNPVTTIKYQLSEPGHVTVIVYNMFGQEVANLIDKHQEAGYYNIQWDASHNASGLYYYYIKAEGTKGMKFDKVKKMLLLK